MAFISSNFYSAALGQEVDLEIYLPNDYTNKTSISQPQAVIYFLHGLSRSQKYFKELSATNRYARDKQLAVVYISAPQSWYSDMVHGMKYYTYITEELQDKDRYQTVYSREVGSAAAPTAGLHWTEELLEKAHSFHLQELLYRMLIYKQAKPIAERINHVINNIEFRSNFNLLFKHLLRSCNAHVTVNM